MNVSDTRGWIIVSLVIVLAIGIGIFLTAQARSVVHERHAVSEMARAEQARAHAMTDHMEEQIAEYEQRIRAYEEEIHQLRGGR